MSAVMEQDLDDDLVDRDDRPDANRPGVLELGLMTREAAKARLAELEPAAEEPTSESVETRLVEARERVTKTGQLDADYADAFVDSYLAARAEREPVAAPARRPPPIAPARPATRTREHRSSATSATTGDDDSGDDEPPPRVAALEAAHSEACGLALDAEELGMLDDADMADAIRRRVLAQIDEVRRTAS